MRIIQLFIILILSIYTTKTHSQNIDKYILIDIYKTQNKHTEIIEFIDSLPTESINTEIQFHKAEALYNNGLVEDALHIFLQIQSSNHDNITLFISKCYSQLNVFDSSILYLEQYLKSNKKIPAGEIKTDAAFSTIKRDTIWLNIWKKEWYSKYELLYNDALFEYKSYNYEYALEILENIIEKRKNTHKEFNLMSEIYFAINDFDNSYYYSKKACDLKPANELYNYNKARALINNGKYNKAMEAINQTINSNSGKVEYHIARSRIALEQKNYLYAIKSIENIAAYYTTDTINYILALAYYHNGNYMNALEYINKCMTGTHIPIWYYELRADLYFKLNIFENAIDDYKKLTEMYITKYKYETQLALCFIELKDYTTACKHWHEAEKRGYMKARENILKYCY